MASGSSSLKRGSVSAPTISRSARITLAMYRGCRYSTTSSRRSNAAMRRSSSAMRLSAMGGTMARRPTRVLWQMRDAA
jgi:hypothetical protein